MRSYIEYTHYQRMLIAKSIYSEIIKGRASKGLSVSDNILKRYSIICNKCRKLKVE